MQDKKNGFSGIELAIIIAVLSIFSAVAIPAFNCVRRRAISTAAQETIREIKEECESNYIYGIDKFTSSNPDKYQISASGSNSCSGGTVTLTPEDTSLYPTYLYKFEDSELSYNFKGQTGTSYIACNKLICGNSEENLKKIILNYDFVMKDSYVTRDCSAYVVVNGPTWSEAEANALKLGGHLITINDSDEWKWFRNEYKPEKYAYPESYNYFPDGEVQLWVGLNDAEQENSHNWISEEAVSLKLNELNFTQGLDKDYKKNKFGVWQWEQQRITYYDNNINQWKKDGWPESAYNIRGVAEIKLESKKCIS